MRGRVNAERWKCGVLSAEDSGKIEDRILNRR